jgi:hypothetical protein
VSMYLEMLSQSIPELRVAQDIPAFLVKTVKDLGNAASCQPGASMIC